MRLSENKWIVPFMLLMTVPVNAQPDRVGLAAAALRGSFSFEMVPDLVVKRVSNSDRTTIDGTDGVAITGSVVQGEFAEYHAIYDPSKVRIVYSGMIIGN